MNTNTNHIIFLMLILTVSNGVLCLAVADDDHRHTTWYHKNYDHDDDDDDDHESEHGERKHERHGDHNYSESYLKKVNNPTYKQECGACHFAYQPEFLPSASWMKLLANLEDHFGEPVKIEDNSKQVISDYLKANSAENSSTKRAVKIMRSVGKHVPVRITDIQYIREKHHKITSDILKRKSIGSLSNCSACHTTAENGNYDEDDVNIPQ